MARITKAQHALEAARVAAQIEAFEQGVTWFKAYPEALLVEPHWEAQRRFGPDDPHMQVWAFVQGFTVARHRRDEYLREQKQDEGNPT